MEVFREIEGSNGLYFVSNTGSVKSKWGPLGGWENRKKYLMVALYITPRKRTMRMVHRLVAQAFLPNPRNLPQVNHKNGIKSDNRAENLEWCTNQENINHAILNGLIDTRGEKSGKNVHSESLVREILETEPSVTSVQLSKRHGLSACYISHLRAGRRWRWLWEQYNG